MKEGYFIYNSSTILKGTIEEKVFRIEAENPNAGVRGYILVNPQFISSMYYRYYYIMSVKCNYKGVSFSDYEFNLKNGELDVSFRNPSKVWRFNKMSLADFLERYWK